MCVYWFHDFVFIISWSLTLRTILFGIHKYLLLKQVFLCLLQALGVFGLCQLHSFVDYIRSKMSQEDFEVLFKALVVTAASISVALFGILTITGIHMSEW